jgi:hypothetical protein
MVMKFYHIASGKLVQVDDEVEDAVGWVGTVQNWTRPNADAPNGSMTVAFEEGKDRVYNPNETRAPQAYGCEFRDDEV